MRVMECGDFLEIICQGQWRGDVQRRPLATELSFRWIKLPLTFQRLEAVYTSDELVQKPDDWVTSGIFELS